MMRPLRWCLAAVLACTALAVAPASGQDADGDTIPDRVELVLGSDLNRADELVLVAESPARDDGSPDLRRLYMAHVAADRYIWKVEFAEEFPVTGDTLVLYVDADNDPDTGRQDKPEVVGTDVQYSCGGANVGASVGNPNVFEGGRTAARGIPEGNAVWIADEVKLHREGDAAVVRVRLLVQRAGDGSDSTDWRQVRVPVFTDRELPELPGLDRLVNKGLRREQVEPAPGTRDNLPPRRPQPPVPFGGNGRAPERGATVERERVGIDLLEEAGVARVGELVSVGIPFGRGEVFDARMIRVIDDTGAELPAQATATSFWPDDSIRWALVDLLADLGAGEQTQLTVEYGSAVSRAPVPDALRIEQRDDAIVVSTGPMEVMVPTDRMALLGEVRVNGRPVGATPEGIVVVGESGEVYRLANATPQVRFEKRGPLATTIRLEAPYVSDDGSEYLRAIVRLTFVAGSTTVQIAATHIDDWLETEFTDIRSLSMPIELAAGGASARFAGPEGQDGIQADVGPGARVMQKHDQLAAVGDEEIEGLRLPGAMDYRAADGSGVVVTLPDFWQEYPKALSADRDRALVEILPALDGEDFWTELPENLRYPFVEGCYRMKWGMAKTTRMALRFHGSGDESDVTAAALALDMPLVPVIDSARYAQTGALGDMAPLREGEFAAWDNDVARRFAEHMALKESEREYGFLNWGDWFGERGRNWGNNEYDLPHGLFMQFARTGNRDYYRLALAAARHQADVDCVHAYPDIMNVGAMAPHSVCHTGEWSQHLAAPSWSYPYTSMTTAANGHTWADGMVDAWYLCGEPRVMECAIGLGEHIAFAMAPTFEHLGTHERSAGWSLAAIMALQRATGDPVYLEAARQIVEVALREQDLEGTGAWPHVLPRDHAAGYPGAVGNVAFLIGILMSGMQDYHQATGDPRVLTSMEAGCRWLRDVMWVPGRWAFHYTSSPAYLNNPEKAGSGTTMLIIAPMAYVAERTGDAELMDIVAQAFAGVLRDGGSGWGKSFAQELHFASDVLAALDRADEGREAVRLARRLDLQELRRETMLSAPQATALRVRGPVDKVIHLLREGEEVFAIEATRLPYGARNHEEDTGTLEVLAPDGEVVAREQFDTDEEWSWARELPAGGPQGTYTVRIHDDMRATWDINCTGGRRVIELVPGLSLGGIGSGRWALYAPAGVTQFTLTVVDWHRGHFGAMVLGTNGQVLAAEDVTQPAEGAGRQAVLQVTLPANPDGMMLDVVLYTDMDLNVAVKGIPPYLAPSPEAWFDPRTP